MKEQKEKGALPIDDGSICIVERNGVPFVIETGLLPLKSTFNFLNSVFRSRWIYRNPYLYEEMPDWLFRSWNMIHKNASRAAILLSRQVITDMSNVMFSSKVFRLDRVVFVTHEKDPAKPLLIDKDNYITKFDSHLPMDPTKVEVIIHKPWENWVGSAVSDRINKIKHESKMTEDKRKPELILN